MAALVAVELLLTLATFRFHHPVQHPVQIGPRLVENSSVSSPASYPWWSSQPTTVTQQWGCTSNQFEGTQIPSGYHCPPAPYNHWHHGIDFADSGGQHAVNCDPPTNGNPTGPGYTIYAGRFGTVTKVDVPYPQPDNYVSDLQIQTFDGYFVNLLHIQSVLNNLSVGSLVKPNDPIATVGNYGYPTYSYGCHLHFEIDQTNVLGDNGGYDVDPTQWLSSTTCVGINGMGFGPVTQPAPVADGSGQIHIFVHGTDGSVWHQTYTGGNTGWDCIGGTIQGTPAAVWFNGKIQLFARYADNSVRWATYSGGTCCTWNPVGTGASASDPVAAVLGTSLHLFVRASDNTIWENIGTASGSTVTWGGWHYFPNSIAKIAGDPAVAVDGSSYLYIDATAPDGTVWWNREDSSNNQLGWQQLSGVSNAASNPTLAALPESSTLVTAVKLSDGSLSERIYSTGWSGWLPLNGHLYGAPGSADQSGQDYFAAWGTDNALWYDGCCGWTSLGGAITNSPVAFEYGSLHVFARGTQKDLWERYHSGAWSSWASLGGAIN